MSNITWQSTITSDMIMHLDADELRMLIDELNDVVANTCENYNVQ